MDDAVAVLVKDADRDRWLATQYAPAALRPALFAVHALDLELAKVAATTTDAMLGEIRLAWWRERLVDLDAGQVPAQPVLRALADLVLPRGVTGATLAEFEDGWLALAAGDVAGHVKLRGAAIGAVTATLVGGDAVSGAALGEAWAAGEAARAGHEVAAPVFDRAPAQLRWLAGLAALGMRDVARGVPPEPRATAGRQWVLLRAALTGR
ncbi:squalene/phytoene synthase family protein [Glacieibacterium frigidum]|nr:squalene/phytoene synthase family protein [Glacieibacterium frigidum]